MSTLRDGASPSDKARKLVAELVEVSDKYHNGTHAKSWQIWAVNEIANALAAAAPSLHKEGLPAPDDRNIWSEVRRLTEIRLRSTTTQEPLSAFSADDVRFLLYLIGQRERAFKELTRMTAERAALHKEGAGSDELCECGQPENSIRHSFTAASSVDAHAFKPSKLRYCGRCNQRRYFVDGKCEMCAASPAGRAEQEQKS